MLMNIPDDQFAPIAKLFAGFVGKFALVGFEETDIDKVSYHRLLIKY